jgi:polysaccharide export outer membrane protein
MALAESVPPELAKYILEAQKAKVNEAEIRRSALEAGWPDNVVTQAMEAARPAAKATNSAKQKKKPESAVQTVNRSAAPIEPPSLPAPEPVKQPFNAAPPKAAESANAPASPSPAATTGPAPVVSTPSSDPNRGVPDDYEIGAGDVLSITVWKEPDATVPRVAVRPDGKISVPLIKEIAVAGLTPSQAEKMIAQKLSALIVGADVTVVVNEIHSKKIYVTGRVKKEGPIPMNYPMTLMQALSEAGGLTDYAKRKKIYVLRHENGREYRLPFDYDAALRGERMELNIPLRPGDTIVVP